MDTLTLVLQALAAAKAAAPTRTTTAPLYGTTIAGTRVAESGPGPTKSGSIAKGELPPPLPPAPQAARRTPRAGSPTTHAGATAQVASPSQAASAQLLHPDDGKPLGKACRPGANAALWASMPRVNRRDMRLGGDDRARPSHVWRIARSASQYMGVALVA